MDIPHEEPTSPTDPNRGMNTKVFLLIVLVAAVVIALVLLFIVDRKAPKMMPEPGQKAHPTSQLTSPPGVQRPKPSPLHPATLQASVKPAPLTR